MMGKQDQFNKDFSGNRENDIDPEDQDSLEREVTKPYDPRKVRVDSRPLSIAQIIDFIESEELDIAPDFQRRQVWGERQKSLLIESIFLRIPLPVFYFSADEDGRMQVVDGVQRLSAIRDFYKNVYPLSSLEYLQGELKNKYFKDIQNTLWSRRFQTTTLGIFIIDPQTPDDVKFDIFRRLNTGGTPLNAQEIRHCISKPRTRQYLTKLCNLNAFHTATNNILKDHGRMMDLEVVLRYCAFSLLNDISQYDEYEGMDDLLTKTVRRLDSPVSSNRETDSVSSQQLQDLEERFSKAMESAFNLFGSHAFRKWPSGNNNLLPFNRALFDVWSVLLGRYDNKKIMSCKECIVKGAREMMRTDADFISAISSGTSKFSQVRERFKKVQDLLDRCVK